ncbi:cytochrome P450 2C70 [Austrofundulus limnaeus]|uniref:Cytochrome P450 2C70 n=1 Tax=Austrofundulus limnaeus TaxID=52670 RepID=A0A2I4D3I0_AUSLI|nr:PREDICTED: cytochrome P450 2C70-like [Austrofundulus limnaeus]
MSSLTLIRKNQSSEPEPSETRVQSSTMFVSIVLLWFCFCFILFQLKARRPKNFPPGPPILPVLGTFLHLTSKNLLKDLEQLRQTYGNVYSLFLGSKPAVVINGLKAMKEAMLE